MAYFWIFMFRFAFVILFIFFSPTLFAVPSKTRMQIRKAELALKSPESLQNALNILQEVISDSTFRKLHADERMQIYTLLIATYSRLRKYEEQEMLLTGLLTDTAFTPYWIDLKVSLGGLYLDQNRLIDASKVMKDLLRTPKRRLASKDADAILLLHTKIEKHCEEKLLNAQKYYAQENYIEAASLYQYLFNAAAGHAFIQTYSKQCFDAFLDALTFRLAACYFLNGQFDKALDLFSQHSPHTPLTASLKGIIEKKLGAYDKAYSHLKTVQNPNHYIQWQTFLCGYKTDQLDSLPSRLSPFYADALHKKGIFLWQKKKSDAALTAFFELETEFPTFSKHDEVLFFMGLLLDKKGHDARYVFAELVHDHPDSPFAPESYYRMFSEEDYAQGSPQAISHLKKMPKSYLCSPFGVIATYYVAAFEQEECPQKGLSDAQVKTLTEIIESLTDAIAASKTIQLPPKMQAVFKTFVINAYYKIAECHFTLTHFAEVLDTCTQLQNQISGPHILWHKAAYLKSRAFLLQGNEAQAREELTHMIQYASDHGFEKGESFILALIELAAGRARDGEMDIAHKLLDKAEARSAEDDNEELWLEVILAKSQLARKEGDIDKAMMLLSAVINETSASGLRIQAMYLRAELYELKGRRDLAFRQLQSTAKKGGEWANRAAKKLEEKYGYE